MARYRCTQGDVLDDIVWRYYGRQTGAVEAVLEANPGAAAHGPVLPVDYVLELPDLPASDPVRSTTRLWT